MVQYLSGMKWVLHTNEYRYLASLPITERSQVFSRFWTLKEALLKGKGVGIADPSQPPASFDFSSVQKEQDIWVTAADQWVCMSWIEEDRALAVAFQWMEPIQALSLFQTPPQFVVYVNSTPIHINQSSPELHSILLLNKEVI